jgi:hypothetical protein
MGKISNSAKTNWALDWTVGKKGRDIIENEAEFMTEASATTYLFSTRIPARKRSTYQPHPDPYLIRQMTPKAGYFRNNQKILIDFLASI